MRKSSLSRVSILSLCGESRVVVDFLAGSHLRLAHNSCGPRSVEPLTDPMCLSVPPPPLPGGPQGGRLTTARFNHLWSTRTGPGRRRHVPVNQLVSPKQQSKNHLTSRHCPCTVKRHCINSELMLAQHFHGIVSITYVCWDGCVNSYKQKMLNQCLFDVGPPSTTLDQHQTSIGSKSYVCCVLCLFLIHGVSGHVVIKFSLVSCCLVYCCNIAHCGGGGGRGAGLQHSFITTTEYLCN